MIPGVQNDPRGCKMILGVQNDSRGKSGPWAEKTGVAFLD